MDRWMRYRATVGLLRAWPSEARELEIWSWREREIERDLAPSLPRPSLSRSLAPYLVTRAPTDPPHLVTRAPLLQNGYRSPPAS